ncbi:response regulator [Polaribacter sp.]|uniref:response regulator n=2 Tax=Flavobacteriaceae TaxID=49546 RepID=UPI00404802E6
MITIGIAEDNKDVRDNLLKVFELLGEVDVLFTSENGSVLLDKLRSGFQPEVILMDIEMPEMDGIKTTLEVKKAYPDIAVVMHTIVNQKDRVFQALKNGANGYILKGEKPKAILESIKQAKEGRLPMTPEIAALTLAFFEQYKETTRSKEDYNLTIRESEILEYLCKGMSYKTIADKCFISPRTVNRHIENIYRKLNVHTAIEANNMARKNLWF